MRDPEKLRTYNREYKRKQREAAAASGKCRTCCKADAETPGGYCHACHTGKYVPVAKRAKA